MNIKSKTTKGQNISRIIQGEFMGGVLNVVVKFTSHWARKF